MAQLGSTDMKLPIQYALTYPTRMPSQFKRLDFWQMQPLTFEKPDMDTFRGLKLAYAAGRTGGTMPCVMNAANEVAVEAFLQGSLGFLAIYDIIEETMAARASQQDLSLGLLFEEDAWARAYARQLLAKRK